MRRFFLPLLTAIAWPHGALAMPLPDCAGAVVTASARVTRVEKDGALVLRDGHAFLLEGIRLPGADRPGDPVAKTALDVLRDLATSQVLTLTTTPPSEDRYGRIRAQAFGSVWLQAELLRRGLARVSVAPDRQECSPDFYEAEAQARADRRGLWALPQFAVLKAEGFAAPAGSFQIAEGQVANVASRDGRVFLDFAADYRKSFTVTIAPEDHKAFRDNDPALEALVGRRIRVRGVVEYFHGRPEVALSNPRQIELIQ